MRQNDRPTLHNYLFNLSLPYTYILTTLSTCLSIPGNPVDLIFLDLVEDGTYDTGMVSILLDMYPDTVIIALVNDDETGLSLINLGVQEYLVHNRFHKGFVNQLIATAIKKKKYQRSKEKSAVDYRKFFYESPVPKWVFDMETLRFLDVNEAAVINYGYTREEFLSMTIGDIRPQSETLALIDVVNRDNQNCYYDAHYWRHIRKSGETFFVHIFSYPITYKDRKAKLVLALDVDDKVKTEQANKLLNDKAIEEKNKHEEMISSLKEVVWSMDADSRELLYMNSASEKILGYTEADRKADKNVIINAIHEEDREKYIAALKGIYTSGRMKCEYRFHHKDGTIRNLITTASIKTGTNWGRNTINGITIDVTRLRMTECALQEKAIEMQNMLEATPNAFFAIDNNWNFTYINKEAEKLYKVKREDVIGLNIWKFFPQTLQETKFYTEFHKVMNERKSVVFEEMSPALGIWISANIFPTPNGIAGFFIDVTEKRKHLQKIQEQNDQLREIAWIQSHKVRGPVATILGLMELFNYEQPEDEINKQILQGLKVSTNNLDEIIREVVGITEE